MPAVAPTENAYIITGPTSGIGRRTALELAKHGTVFLVGRDRERLGEVRDAIKSKGGSAVSVVCDLSEPAIVRRAAGQIVELGLPVAGLLNNAGIMNAPHEKLAGLGHDVCDQPSRPVRVHGSAHSASP
jgi:NAD(P)-dependent dehydrogenase (short-subunit alcohol dehydrogenase family)